MKADIFWKSAGRELPHPNGCWEWQRSVRRSGYGRTRFAGREYSSHRLAWQLVNGPIPDGKWVLHKCPGGGNRACCNPAHLKLGDHAENMRDMVENGRASRQGAPRGEKNGTRIHAERLLATRARGERNGSSKLTELQVIGIMARWLQGTPKGRIAREYDVSATLVRYIVTGQLWSYVFQENND